MNVYQHFACHTALPVKLSDVKAHILETGHVHKIIRVPVKLEDYIVRGGFHRFRDLTSYSSGETIALIGYPEDAPEEWQRVIQVKEMLHILDPDEATSPTKAEVNSLIEDLIDEEMERAIGLPAEYDHNGLLHALCILLPRDALDIIRPVYKREGCTIEEVAAWSKLPRGLVKIALRDSWRDGIERI